ncbi:exonuclease domain-containing protein [Marinobacter sp. LV10MA510-1]|uniref:exonuclease domain-containing protein n=1 Tax=Marinobacter sp. LV10MA510-1 TaxID=1415567 RepID=UPI000BF6FC65|nr:exonuclease domain-containing protein [Marinobacter sp. LV10MA510-1]PFG10703.1 DNA polymerase-3 subunit epsilon [Marinobacter sp. LV10MA510-1]
MEFVAIDVETANADMASICQIGLAKYKNGVLEKEWSSLINPEDYFDDINISIHGIDEIDVGGAPTLPEIKLQLAEFLSDSICVSHTHFDRVSIYRAFEKYSLKQLGVTWLDSARVARRTWDECAWSGYGLANICKIIGYEFKHHDALEDAKAAGQIILSAIDKTGLDIEAWISRVGKPIELNRSSIQREGNPEGELYGEILVFTGALLIPRAEAAILAASVGCTIGASITKKTTLLVVGDQDIKKLAGKEKSSKHIKAEQLILKGHKLRILKESDFKELVAQSHEIV